MQEKGRPSQPTLLLGLFLPPCPDSARGRFLAAGVLDSPWGVLWTTNGTSVFERERRFGRRSFVVIRYHRQKSLVLKVQDVESKRDLDKKRPKLKESTGPVVGKGFMKHVFYSQAPILPSIRVSEVAIILPPPSILPRGRRAEPISYRHDHGLCRGR
jgi:hypothetical protein